MSFNNKICNLDIIDIIFKLCDSIDSKTALACVSKCLYKMLRSKAYFILQQDNLRLELKFNKIVKINCINNDCDNILECLGFTTFIYSEKQDNLFDDKNNIIAYSENEKVINRYIPYCKECTYKFVNFGDRNKPIIFQSFYFMHNNIPQSSSYSYL